MAKKIAITYLIVGLVWIALSDIILATISSQLNLTSKTHFFLQSGKGFFYVAVTGGLLYLSLYRRFKSQKLNFQKLKTTEEEFRSLFEENSSPMWIFDNTTLQFLAVNRAAQLLYGYSETEFLNLTLKELRLPEEVMQLEMDRLRYSGKLTNGIVRKHIKKDGRLIYVNIYSNVTNFQGRQAQLATIIDFTDKILAEQENLELTQKLSEQRNYLSSLINTQNNYVIRMDLEGNYTFANKAFLDTFGYSVSTIMGKPFTQFMMPDFTGISKQAANQCVREPGSRVSITIPKVDPNGTMHTIDWELTAILNSANNVTEIQGMGMDITEKKKLFNELADYKERLDNILASIDDVVWSCRPDNFTFNFISEACETVYGYTSEEIAKTPSIIYENILDADKISTDAYLQELLENGKGEHEFRFKCRSGGLKIIYEKGVLLRDENGKPVKINGVSADITHLRQTEKRVEEFSQRITEILENVTLGFFTVDSNWNFTYINKRFEEMSTQNREDLIGENIWKRFPHNIELKTFPQFHQAQSEKVNVQFEEYFEHLQKWFNLNAYPTSDGLAVFFEDVTESKLFQDKIYLERQNLNGLINNTSDLIWSVSKEMRLISANEAFKNTTLKLLDTEFKEGDLVCGGAINPEAKSRLQGYYARAFKGESFKVDETFSMFEKKPESAEVSFNPIRNRKGRIIAVGCFSRNTTEIRQSLQKVQLQNNKLREIAWIQSHQLRLPVANILGLGNLLSLNTDSTDPLFKEMLRLLKTSTEQLDKIIREIVHKTNEVEDSIRVGV